MTMLEFFDYTRRTKAYLFGYTLVEIVTYYPDEALADEWAIYSSITS